MGAVLVEPKRMVGHDVVTLQHYAAAPVVCELRIPDSIVVRVGCPNMSKEA